MVNTYKNIKMISNFTNDLHVVFLGLSDDFMITEDISFYSKTIMPGFKTTLLPGFISDGDSIPPWLKGIVRLSQRRYQRAYAFHDAWFRVWAYYNIIFPDAPVAKQHAKYPTLKQSNLLLDEGLEVLGANAYARSKVYTGLKIAGRPTKNKAQIINAMQYVRFEHFEMIPEVKEKSSMLFFL